MKLLKSKLAMIATIGLLSACVGLPVTNPTGGVTTPTGTNSVAKLQSGEWVVQSINGKAVNTPISPTLNFGQTFQLTGHTSCNTYFAGYLLTGPSIIIKQAGTTRMACEPAVMEQEQRFLKQLSSTQMWNIDSSNTLVLTGTSGVIVAKRR